MILYLHKCNIRCSVLPKVYQAEAFPGRANRWWVSSGSEFEPICGYSRAMRFGNRVSVSGTTATHDADRAIGVDDMRAQAVYILGNISASLSVLGVTVEDVTRTQVFMTNYSKWEDVSRVTWSIFRQLPAG